MGGGTGTGVLGRQVYVVPNFSSSYTSQTVQQIESLDPGYIWEARLYFPAGEGSFSPGRVSNLKSRLDEALSSFNPSQRIIGQHHTIVVRKVRRIRSTKG